LKLRILIFILGVLAAGLVGAEGHGASQSRISTSAEAGFHLDYGNHPIADYAIDERIFDRLGLFDPSDNGPSTRYSVELDLENEDSDWSFEVIVTVEF
jgi:hypothetical protein